MSILTQQIAGAYIGAQVVESDGLVGVLTGTNITYLTVKINGEFYDFDYDQCRLILTPLSAISDEDAVEVAKICGKRISEDVEREDCFDFVGFQYYLIELFETGSDVRDITLDKAIKAIDYLRSDKRPDGTAKLVYDLGYGPIKSLIGEGLAISSI